MRLKGEFWILTTLLMLILAVISYYVFYNSSLMMFLLVESVLLLTFFYLLFFYRRIIKPLHTIGNGMELLKEQDFSSRLGRVGQAEADRVVDVFNRMMEQLKNERLRLREQNNFLDLLINASPMGVVILSLDDEIQSLNPAACSIFGLHSASDMIGKRLSAIDSPLVDELAKIPMFEATIVRLNDANIYKCTYSSFVDRGYHHPFYLIETLTCEVFRAEKRAYEKVIRMISHEVNNTTAGITSTLDTLESAFSGMDDMEDICEVLRVSIDRCYSMSRFITNFADVVRIPEPQTEHSDLNMVVANCKRFMERRCGEKSIDIVLQLDSQPVMVDIDVSLFDQVLVNIIKNSAESIGEDGKIYIKTSNPPAYLEISDTGKGIDKETEKRLFSPFFSTKPNGQGIGLILIREVLLKHGCKFSLRTYPDGLTRFKIAFQ